MNQHLILVLLALGVFSASLGVALAHPVATRALAIVGAILGGMAAVGLLA